MTYVRNVVSVMGMIGQIHDTSSIIFKDAIFNLTYHHRHFNIAPCLRVKLRTLLCHMQKNLEVGSITTNVITVGPIKDWDGVITILFAPEVVL